MASVKNNSTKVKYSFVCKKEKVPFGLVWEKAGT